jgi:type III pantothenate kinase
MNLVIDIGNSLAKIGIFENKNLIKTDTFDDFSLKYLEDYLESNLITACILASVAAEHSEIKSFLHDLSFFIELNANTKLPVKNRYTTPVTLGNDRLANVVGAYAAFPNRNILVIDAGTCLKFDFINEHNEYMGGAISPGLHMRYQALHHFTERLPQLEPQKNVELIGDSTSNSIHSGVVNGMTAEIKGIIQQYEKNSNDLQIILCGGDARYFSNHLKNNIFAAPYLTLQGLNEILLYNQ